ncbi:diacylglycerol/polyprenol kinase family protein [Chloroflexota bacterium]
MLRTNLIATIITFGTAFVWLKINNIAAQKHWISSHLSRKFIHIGTGPIFVLCWLLFNDNPVARFLAALVPLAITIQFILVGLGVIRDEASVQAMSRSGDRREILQGPLYYGVIFVIITIIYWKYTPIGIVALMMVCGGDGLADIIGRRFGKLKLSWSGSKSWAGSLGMFFGGWSLSIIIVALYIYADIFFGPLTIYIPAISLIAFAATIVETIPIPDIDNISIALISLVLGHLLF